MNAADSLAWGELLTAQGNGEQLQCRELHSWINTLLTIPLMSCTRPENWRRKPKTRTLRVLTFRNRNTGDHLSTNVFEGVRHRLSEETTGLWVLIDTHTIEVEL